MRWLVKEWPYAGILTAGFLLLLFPFIYALGLPVALIYLQLPLYMIHQFEEHDQDRFRTFANQVLAGGREVLTPTSIFVINSAGVWGVDLLALYLAYYHNLALGLIAIYLPLFNALTHLLATVKLRRYNPGLWTAIGLFLPFGIWSLIVVSKASHADWPMQAICFGVALVVHILIFAYAGSRLRKLA